MHFCRGLNWIIILVNTFKVKRSFLLLNLQVIISRKHKSLVFHVDAYVVQRSLINPLESKKCIGISATKLRQEVFVCLPCFGDDGKLTFYARPCVSVYNFE